MNILAVGLNHKTAEVDLRESVAFPESSIEYSLKRLTSLPSIREAVILSTCNRVELYVVSSDVKLAQEQLENFLSEHHGVSKRALGKALYKHTNKAAVRHLFNVASSLDSMLLGESQILGQLKKAYGQAVSSETVGPVLNRLVPKSFSVAKRVRTETAVGCRDTSVPVAAVDLIQTKMGSLKDKTILLIGAGKMSEVAGQQLAKKGATAIYVTNRTFDRSQELAALFNGEAVPFEDMLSRLKDVDIVLSSTSAPHLVLSRQDVVKARENGPYNPLLLVDIAVPRDIDPACGEIEGVQLFDVDALRGKTADSLLNREGEECRAFEIVEEEIKKHQAWQAERGASPIIIALQAQLEKIRLEELKRSRSKLGQLTDDQMIEIENLTTSIVRKVLHGPAIAMKKLSTEQDKDISIENLSLLLSAIK